MNKLNEYKTQPMLSERAKDFIYSNECVVPDDIRTELEQYVKDIQPFVDKARTKLINQFERVFK